jgi:hypothetical protein
MKYFMLILIGVLFFGKTGTVVSQTAYPKNYFRSPVDYRILLAGSFGELRKNHFHSGIDIRTDGQVGKPLYAVADGYVSRINISAGGFGKALYITCPNGFVSVYGHLKGFNKVIGDWIRVQQYKNESFAIDIPVDPGVLKVKKGDLVAFSGNSGASAGPHLHFEMRDAATQNAIDPLLFGFDIRDIIPPKIEKVRIYPADGNSKVNGSDNPLSLPVSGQGSTYQVISRDITEVSGTVIFGISAIDQMNDSGMKDGVHSIELYVDTTLVFSQSIDQFAFAETRYVNSLLDYPLLVQYNTLVQRSYVAPNNKLRIYGTVKNRGLVSFTDDRTHKILYQVKDATGNTSRLAFWVKSVPPAASPAKAKKIQAGTLFSCKSENSFIRDDIKLTLPQDALYEDLDFVYSVSPRVHGTWSDLHHLQNELTPVHSFCTLSIKPVGLPGRLSSKALIAIEQSPGHFSSRGGTFANGWVTTQIREFGNYAVLVDTIPPVIRPLNITGNKKVNQQVTFAFRITDDLSGIKQYRGTLNGKWILMEYDAKSNLLTYYYDDRLLHGKNTFRLVVKDDSGNESSYAVTLFR